MTTATIIQRTLVTELALIRAVSTVILAVAQLVRRQADRGVVGAGMGGWPAGQGLTVLLVGVIFTVAVAITHPRLADAPGGVLAAKLDIRVTNMGHALTALLIAGIHAVGVPVAAPPQGDAQAI